MGLRVFISYSHRDEELKERLLAHLSPLTRISAINPWDDRRIRASEKWREEIDRALGACDLALLLISAAFLKSDFCHYEVTQLLERHAEEGVRVVPVILRPCLWDALPWLAQFEALPTDAKPVTLTRPYDKALTQVAKAIHELCQQPVRSVPPRLSVVTRSVAIDAPIVSEAKLPATGLELFGRDPELERLDVAWGSPHTHVVTVIGFGGVGKSALTNRWLARMRRDGFRGARRVFAWSFYSQGTRDNIASADQFVNAALIFFGDPDPTKGSPWDKGERLAQLIRKQPTLLVLDGVEPLQSSDSGDFGKSKDPGLECLLRELAASMNGLCLVSSRVELTDLAGFDTVEQISLDRLSPEAGRALLRAADVQGSADELDAAVEEHQGHALALVLLAEYLREFHNGDITRRGYVPLLDEEMPQGSHAFRVMEAYDAALKRDGREVERAVLRIVGLFDRPAAKGCVDALRAKPTIAGVTDTVVGLSDGQWQHAVANLRRLRLVLAPQADDGSLDAHPLVREYFGQKLEAESPDGFRAAHGRLYEHLRDTTKEFPDTLAEMAPLFQAVYHGCRAGRYQEALGEVYSRRMERGNSFFSSWSLGANSELLAACAGFFAESWSEPMARLEPRQRAYLLNQSAQCLRALGRLSEALYAYGASLTLDVDGGDWTNASTAAQNITAAALASGDLAAAEGAAGQALGFAEKAGDAFGRTYSEAYVGYVLRCQGALAAARPHFEEAERRQREWSGRDRYLYSIRGWQYCALLLDLGLAEDARQRAAHTLKVAERNHWLLDTGLDNVTLGRAHHRLATGGVGTEAAAEARLRHDTAVQRVRAATEQDVLPHALLARAAFHRDFGERGQAERDLREALTLATRYGFRLHETDARLLEGHMTLDGEAPDAKTAEAALARARALVEETGYHLRDADLLILEGRLVALRGDREVGRRLLEQAVTVARREEADTAVYQAAVDEAERYLGEV